MSERAPRIKLPAYFPWSLGQIVGGQVDHDFWPQETPPLVDRVSPLVLKLRTLADQSVPRSRQHSLITFRPALDVLATYLTARFGLYGEESRGEIVPPCNYPLPLQQTIMQLAEI